MSKKPLAGGLKPFSSHRLIVKSLRDTLEVECTCGTWDMKYKPKPEDTDKVLRKHATEAHGAHVRRATRKN